MHPRPFRFLAAATSISLSAAGLLAARPAGAAGLHEIHVNTTKDVVGNDGRCSLREAITAAMSNTPSGGKAGECDAGINTGELVTLKKHMTYELTRGGNTDEDDNASGDIDITPITTGSFTLEGGPGTVIEQQAKGQRVFDIAQNSPLVGFRDLTITGGHAGAPLPSGGASRDGGGIFSEGRTALDHVRVTGNHAGNAPHAGSGVGGSGGGIFHTGTTTLSIQDSTISNNTAGHGAPSGGFNNGSKGGDGGGIRDTSIAELTLLRSTVSNNRAGDGGDGVKRESPIVGNDGGGGGSGGGLAAGALSSIDESTFSGNRAGDGGDGGAGGSDGTNTYDGGNGGLGGDGGGIWSADGADIHIATSTMSGNHGGAGGKKGPADGGVQPGANGEAGSGGGLSLFGSSTLANDTISGNEATFAGGILTDGQNHSMNNVTITENHAQYAGGYEHSVSGTATLYNTILANNHAGTANDCSGTFNGNHYDLIGDTAGCTGFSGADIIADPKLGPLEDNGGPTKTHKLKNDSPAINAGYPSVPTGTPPTCEVTDQRNETRSDCDIGAFEKI